MMIAAAEHGVHIGCLAYQMLSAIPLLHLAESAASSHIQSHLPRRAPPRRPCCVPPPWQTPWQVQAVFSSWRRSHLWRAGVRNGTPRIGSLEANT